MRLKILGVFIIPFLLVSCASIPPEAPELSIELGKRISAIEKSNIKLLNRFFDQNQLNEIQKTALKRASKLEKVQVKLKKANAKIMYPEIKVNR